MFDEKLIKKMRKQFKRWGVAEEDTEKFIEGLTDTADDEDVEVEEETAEIVEKPEEEKVEETEEVVEEETPAETEEETETIEEEVKEEAEETEEAKEEVIEHEEGDKDKWENAEAKFTALDGEIAKLKSIVEELRDRVEGGAFGTTGKLPPQEDDEWEGSHTKAYFKNKRF